MESITLSHNVKRIVPVSSSKTASQTVCSILSIFEVTFLGSVLLTTFAIKSIFF